jgi:hypothetical protein
MKTCIGLVLALLLAGCGNAPRVPDWQMTAQSSMERATSAYLSGKAQIEASEFARAREQIASTGQIGLLIRIELIRCAARVAALAEDGCPGFERLRADATAADIAYANYLAGKATDVALLPEVQRAAASANSPQAAAAAVQAITDPFSQLLASGALLKAGRATPEVLTQAVATASAQGWRRALLAWLQLQVQRAEQAGDSSAAAQLRRRIALADGTLAP